MKNLEEPLSFASLEEENSAAWDDYRALIAKLPVYRSREQQRALDAAQAKAERTKWTLDSKRFWHNYHSREAHV